MSREADFLAKTSLFGDFTREQRERLAALARRRQWPAGEIVFVEMSEGDEFYVVEEGTAAVQIALANKDSEFEIIRLGPGEVVGEVAFIEEGQRSATVSAETDLTMLVWDNAELRAACEQDFELGYRLVTAIARVLAARLRRWNVKLLDESLWGL